ncbi:hypothetical protein A2U01_0111891, partial [Trifolium medium]|nr:hypothetical protein [Trifolium medium]
MSGARRRSGRLRRYEEEESFKLWRIFETSLPRSV